MDLKSGLMILKQNRHITAYRVYEYLKSCMRAQKCMFCIVYFLNLSA
jgi:hypothetical protein